MALKLSDQLNDWATYRGDPVDDVRALEVERDSWRGIAEANTRAYGQLQQERDTRAREAAGYRAMHTALSERIDQLISIYPDRWYASEEREVLIRERDAWMQECLEAQQELGQLKAAQVSQGARDRQAPISEASLELPSAPSSGTLGILPENQKPVHKSGVPNPKKLPRFVRRSRAKT